MINAMRERERIKKSEGNWGNAGFGFLCLVFIGKSLRSYCLGFRI